MKRVITSELKGFRLDKALASFETSFSRSKIQTLIDDNKVKVNGEYVKSSYKVNVDDIVEYELEFENKSTMQGEDIDLDVIYEDDDLAIINKPVGMVVHPGAGNHEHTLANALINRFSDLSSVNGDSRPGIVHRIDKDTSGLLVVAKSDFAHNYLSDELKSHTISRKYYALVKGEIKENSAVIKAPIGRDKTNRLKMGIDLVHGKEAVTHFIVVKRYVGYTLVECILETGRTHQIRVHMNYIGYPVIGDPMYGKNNRDIYSSGQLLHAHEISFVHPRTNKTMTFSCDIPDHFKNVLEQLKEKK